MRQRGSVHSKLFLQERDHWHESGMYQEYVLGEMLHSAEYAWVLRRDDVRVHIMHGDGQLPSQTRMEAEAGQNTALEQLGSASNWEFILHLVESVYQGLISIGQSRLQPGTTKHVVAQIKEDLKEHISSNGAS